MGPRRVLRLGPRAKKPFLEIFLKTNGNFLCLTTNITDYYAYTQIYILLKCEQITVEVHIILNFLL
jgi:hypothetical protein